MSTDAAVPEAAARRAPQLHHCGAVHLLLRLRL